MATEVYSRVEFGDFHHNDTETPMTANAVPTSWPPMNPACESCLWAIAAEYAVGALDPVPEIGWNLSRAAALCALQGRETCGNGHSFDGTLNRNRAVLEMLDGWGDEGLIHLTKTAPVFCDTPPGGRCRMFDDLGQPLYVDDDHLAHSTGAVLIAPVTVDAARRAQGD